MFLLGIPFEPALAGITANIFIKPFSKLLSFHYKSTAKLYRKNETAKHLWIIIVDLFLNFSTFAARKSTNVFNHELS